MQQQMQFQFMTDMENRNAEEEAQKSAEVAQHYIRVGAAVFAIVAIFVTYVIYSVYTVASS